jgi:carboxyl-terminal processing protease
MPNSKLFYRSHFTSGLMIENYCSLRRRTTNYLKIIHITVLVFVFAFTGCKVAEQNVQKRQVLDPVAEGRQMVEKVYTTIGTEYVEPVHPHRLLVSAAQGIEKEFRDVALLQEISGDIRVLSPVTRKAYSMDISETDARIALNEIYAYGVNTYGRSQPLKIAYIMTNRMSESLDSHSNVLTPEAFKELKTGASGKLSGIGITITMREKKVTVITPIEGSPAYRSGIQTGDVILKVDGVPVYDLQTAVKAIRGPVGTFVAVTISRTGLPQPFELRLLRETITVKSVKTVAFDTGIHYLRVTHFSNETAKDIEAILRRSKQFSMPMKGLIIDLRNNPGGLLSQTLKSTDYFVRDGQLLTIKGNTAKKSQKFSATIDGTEGDFPIVVLINNGSASSAEIMAGALRSLDRALLIGDVTFGKGSVQTILGLPGGYGLKLTIARYELPGGRRIDRIGIQPDIILSTDAEALREKDLYGPAAVKKRSGRTDNGDKAFRPSRNGKLDTVRLMEDPAIDRAVQILKRTRSARLKDMLAADLSIQTAAASPVRPALQTLSSAPAGIRPRLFVLTIGVSRYKEARLSLAYAEKDAQAMAAALGAQNTSLFREVRTKVLVDEAVSRDSILESMNSFLGQAVSSDVVLIFVAGHGIKRSATDTFYFLPHEANHQNMTTKGLRWSDFKEEVAALGARVKNVILMLDTCHSGALQIGMRGIGVTPDLSSAFQRKGTYVIAAASADEAAVEAGTWGHGAFTYAILSGLKGGADYNSDRIVDVLELFHYVEARVAEMTKGQQHPRFQMGGGALPLCASH